MTDWRDGAGDFRRNLGGEKGGGEGERVWEDGECGGEELEAKMAGEIVSEVSALGLRGSALLVRDVLQSELLDDWRGENLIEGEDDREDDREDDGEHEDGEYEDEEFEAKMTGEILSEDKVDLSECKEN